jgi:hypothetical protein
MPGTRIVSAASAAAHGRGGTTWNASTLPGNVAVTGGPQTQTS